MSWCKVLKKKGVFFTQKKIYAKTCRKCTKQRHHEEQETHQGKKKMDAMTIAISQQTKRTIQ